jgi:hypothetical protein
MVLYRRTIHIPNHISNKFCGRVCVRVRACVRARARMCAFIKMPISLIIEILHKTSSISCNHFEDSKDNTYISIGGDAVCESNIFFYNCAIIVAID